MRWLVFLLFLLSPMLITATSSSPIELQNASDIRDAEKLDRQVDRLFAKVRQCAAAGLAPAAECHCQYPGKLQNARSTYKALLEKHPHWEGRAVIWWDPQRSYSSNIHFGGLRYQIGRPCSTLGT